MAFSVFILILAVYTVINVVCEVFLGGMFDNVTIPDGAPENVVNIAQNFILVVTVLMILPQIYVGIKGIIVARKPNSSKGHIIWACVLLVFVLIGVVSELINIISSGAFEGRLFGLLDSALEAVFYFEFIMYARRVRSGH